MEEKTYVDDIDRSVYDIKNDEKDSFRLQEGLTPEIVERISKESNRAISRGFLVVHGSGGTDHRGNEAIYHGRVYRFRRRKGKAY